MKLCIVVVGFLVTSVACDPFDPYGCDAREELVLVDRALADGAVGQAYDEEIAFNAEGDGEHIAFAEVSALDGETLPPGLAIEERDGGFHVVGTPTESGTFDFRVRASEFGTQCSGRTAESTISVVIGQ